MIKYDDIAVTSLRLDAARCARRIYYLAAIRRAVDPAAQFIHRVSRVESGPESALDIFPWRAALRYGYIIENLEH